MVSISDEVRHLRQYYGSQYMYILICLTDTKNQYVIHYVTQILIFFFIIE